MSGVLLEQKRSVAVKVLGGKSAEKSAPVFSGGYQPLTPTFSTTATVGKCPKLKWEFRSWLEQNVPPTVHTRRSEERESSTCVKHYI